MSFPLVPVTAALALSVLSLPSLFGQAERVPNPQLGFNPVVPRPAPAPAQDPAAADPNAAPDAGPAVPPPKDDDLIQLMASLAADGFAVREKAQAALNTYAKAHPSLIKPPVLEHYLASNDPEVRYRLQAVLFEAVANEFRNRPRGFLGIKMEPSRTLGENGKRIGSILIREVLANTAASRVRLRPGDHIIGVDDLTFEAGVSAFPPRDPNTQKFQDYIQARKKGEVVELKIRRGNQNLTLKVALGLYPEELKAQEPFFAQYEEERHFKAWLNEVKAEAEAPKESP